MKGYPMYIMILPVLLTGCASATKYGGGTEDGVEVYYTHNNFAAADNVAAQHCQMYGKEAKRVKCGAVILSCIYACTEPNNRTQVTSQNQTFSDRQPNNIIEPSYQPSYQPSPNVIPQNTTNLDDAKDKCAELGFETGTEKFGDCVLKLSK